MLNPWMAVRNLINGWTGNEISHRHLDQNRIETTIDGGLLGKTRGGILKHLLWQRCEALGVDIVYFISWYGSWGKKEFGHNKHLYR